MSRGRCLSLDRTQGKNQNLITKSGVYTQERSPNRTRIHATPQHAASTPNIFGRKSGGANGMGSIPIEEGEFLDDFVEPPFYDPPAESSFEEVMFRMGTPPPATQPTAAERLDAFRTEVAEVVYLDDLQKHISAHVGTSSGDGEQSLSVQVDNIRRVAASVTEKTEEQLPKPRKIPVLSEDPYDIPPPPKNPKDVVAMIRRAHAIERLRALEEAKAPKVDTSKASAKGIRVQRKPATQVPSLPKPQAPSAAKAPQRSVPQSAAPQRAASRKPAPQASVPQKAAPQRAAPKRAAPQRTASQSAAQQRAAPQRAASQRAAPQKEAPQRAASQRAAPQRAAQQRAAPQRAAPQRAAPQRAASQRAAQQRAAPQKAAPQKAAPQRAAPQTAASQRTAPQKAGPKTAAPQRAAVQRGASLRAVPQKAVPQREASKGVAVQKPRVAAKKSQIRQPQLQPAYTSEGHPSTVSKTRKIAGLKAKQKLVPKPQAPEAPELKSPERRPPSPKPPKTPFEALLERVSLIRSRAIATPTMVEEIQQILSPTPQDEVGELDEFELLEELYGAVPDQYTEVQQDATDLDSRMRAMQHILQTPPSGVTALVELEASEEQYTAVSEEYPVVQEDATDLENRMNTLEHILQTPPSETATDEQQYEAAIGEAMAAVADEIGLLQEPVHVSPSRTRSRSPLASLRQQTFDDALFEDIDIPEFDIGDVPEFAFSAEAMTDAGFDLGYEIPLHEITIPEFDDDVSFDEPEVGDISSPELTDLSISDDELALEPDYPSQTSTEDEAVETTAAGETSEDAQTEAELGLQAELDLDISLPNMFESSPPPKPKTPPSKPEAEKPLDPKGPIVIPPHPRDPKDHRAMVRRAQAIQKKRAEEAALAAASAPVSKEKKKKREIKSTIPKRAPPTKKAPPQKKKTDRKQKRVHPPGEYSPSYVRAIARARSLAGLRNVSLALNPELLAQIAEQKAAREAELAAIEALPPTERMREKMRRMRQTTGGLPRPSIEALATLEAIRSSLPQPMVPKRKWRPSARLRVDHRVHPSERVFKKNFGRILAPSRKTQRKKGWKKLDVMSPIVEDTEEVGEFMHFSPLRPREGLIRLRYLQEEAIRRAAETISAAEEEQAAISIETPLRSPEGQSPRFSPVRMLSPTSPRTEEIRSERITTSIGPHGGTETVREEATELSTIEDGEIHTSTRQITTRTDEYGNVSYQVQEGTGLTGEEEAISDDLSLIEPPEYLDTLDIPAPVDPSIPTPTEIINRIISDIQERRSSALPDIPESSPPVSPHVIDFPQDLPDEELSDTETPELERTPPRVSPPIRALSPVERDPRLYALGEVPPTTPRQATPKAATPPSRISPPPELVQRVSPPPKPKSPERQIVIPPHPKDPRDYTAMIRRAQAIQKLRKQQEEQAAKTAPPKKVPAKSSRVPISRWVGPPPKKETKKPSRGRLVLKKRVSKTLPKKTEEERIDEDGEVLRPLAQRYIEAVARARLLHGLRNRTALLNPEVAAKLAARKAAREAAKAAFDALPEAEKIKKRMEKLRKIPTRKRPVQPSAEILGTLAAIRATLPSPRRSPQTPIIAYPSAYLPQAPVRAHPPSHVDELRTVLEREPIPSPIPAEPEPQRVPSPEGAHYVEAAPAYHRVLSPAADILDFMDISLEDFENMEADLRDQLEAELEAQLEAEAQLYNYETPTRGKRHPRRRLIREISPSSREPETEPHIPSQPLEIVERERTPPEPYYDPMYDFRVTAEDVVLETSQLMIETPPRNIEERFQRLLAAQATIPSQYVEQFDETPATPPIVFSPIRIISPSRAIEEIEEETSIIEEDEQLLNIDGPERQTYAVKRFVDLEDMPFDELEYEVQPNLHDVSIERPVTPLPTPSGIIRRIRTEYQQRLQQSTRPSPTISPEMLELPQDVPDEELLELSAPLLIQSPKVTPKRPRSPRVSLPMVWGEARPATPVTPVAPSPRKTTPVREPTPPQQEDVPEKVPTPKDPIVIPAHPRDPRDYAAMIRRAQAIHRLNKQREAEEAARAPPLPPQHPKRGRVPISRWQGPPPRKVSSKPRKKLVLKKRAPKRPAATDEREIPSEPPPLPQKYIDDVARARLLRGLRNLSALLNPKRAARIAAEKAAFDAMSEVEKIRVRLSRLQKRPHRRRRVQPTMEQIIYLEALKAIGGRPQTLSPDISEMPSPPSVAPSVDYRQIAEDQERSLAEFLEAEKLPRIEDSSLAEYEALEALDAAQGQPVTPIDMSQLISDLQQQLVTPPRIDPRERYRQLMEQRIAPATPVVSPVKTPEIRYSPVTLISSPSRDEQRAEKSTTHVTTSGDKTIREQVIETSEMVDGNLQRFTSHVATAIDPQGNVTMRVSERSVSAREISPESADLGEIEEPSFLDTTPVTPIERPRPRDVIDRIGRELRARYRPEVPTGHLLELRTPPPMLPLPKDVLAEELLHMSYPDLEASPPRSPVRSPSLSPARSPDISIPKIFESTPPPPTPTLFAVSPIRQRAPSPEGPIVVPAHPRDPRDYRTMVRRARQIQKAIEEREAKARAAERVRAEATAAEAAKPKKKERVPISRWTAPPPRKPGKRRKLVLRKRGEVKAAKQTKKAAPLEEVEYPEEPPPLPKHFAEEVALARRLAGIITKLPPRSPIRDYDTVLSRLREAQERGAVVRGQPSLAAAAYLEALRAAMQVQQQVQHESPKTRYQRILAARAVAAPAAEESPLQTPPSEDISYSPIDFVSPRTAEVQRYLLAFEDLDELEELLALEEPSYVDVSQYLADDHTPPPAPSTIISRLRQQYEQERAVLAEESPTPVPDPLQFPEDLPEEELLELSALSFVESPARPETTIAPIDVTIPHYFEETPPRRTPPVLSRSPTVGTTADDIRVASPPLLGVVPGLRVKTPPKPVAVPPHPKDPTDMVAMIKRAQLIQKLRAREAAEKAAAGKATKSRVPISRRVPAKPVPKRGKLVRRTAPKSKIPSDPTKLSQEYIAAVARARKLAGIKPKVAAAEPQQAPPPPPLQPGYETIMERFAALRGTRQTPTSRELSRRQSIINRQQMEERRRLMQELARLREEEEGLEFEPRTPPPPLERLESIRSRIPTTTPISSAHLYSPVKTPEVVDVHYQPIALRLTPPYDFLEDVDIHDIENISLPLDELADYTIDFESDDGDDLEFQLAEMAQAAYPGFHEGVNIAEDALDIASRIQSIRQQLLVSPDRANADVPHEYDEQADQQDIYDEIMNDLEAI